MRRRTSDGAAKTTAVDRSKSDGDTSVPAHQPAVLLPERESGERREETAGGQNLHRARHGKQWNREQTAEGGADKIRKVHAPDVVRP